MAIMSSSCFYWRKIIVSFMMVLFASTGSMAATGEESAAPGRVLAQQAVKQQTLWITADHSKFDILKTEFKSGPQVTKACLTCHTEASLQFHQTIHWTWLDPKTKDTAKLGKGGLSVNNF